MPKSLLLTLDSKGQTDTSDFTINYSPPIRLEDFQYKCALVRLDTYFSWYNISAANQNNQFEYFNGVDTEIITLDDGLYSLQNLIDEIHDHLILNGDATLINDEYQFDLNFELDESSGDVTLLLTNGFEVNFENYGLRNIFGFNSQLYTSDSVSERPANIRNGVNSVLVHCSLVNGSSYINRQVSDVIYSFAVNHAEHEHISYEPTPLYYQVPTRGSISSIRIHFTDQNGNKLSLNNAPVNVTLHLEPDLK